MLSEDTIAAISTPLGFAGIGKIRISGPRALEVASKLFNSINDKKLEEAKTYTAHYGDIVDPQTGQRADEVIVLIMKGPRSFTGEDVIEFDCHGGMVPLQRVLELVLREGVRLAEPGEFSKRAFLNGRIDLAQAEGIIEVINSKTEKGLDLALDHLSGKLSAVIREIKELLIELFAHLEASIDFPEDEIEGFNSQQIGEHLNLIKEKLETLVATSKQGKLYREGIKTVITGKPNVGKSSLLNTLLEEKRAIVTEIPGTTRDIIEEYISLNGIPLKMIDTAGIRETEDLVEQIGVERARNSLEMADLVLMMLDNSQGLDNSDLNIYQLVKNKPVIIVVNKTDLAPQITEEEIKEKFSQHSLIPISIKEERGLADLKRAIIDQVLDRELSSEQTVFITRARHKNALEKALKALERVINSYHNGFPNDFLTIDLKEALNALGEITGETVTEEIIDRIFIDFCLGK